MTPPHSGRPRAAANTRRSRHARCSVSRMRRNCRKRTSIVASAATTASLTTSVVSMNCVAESSFTSTGIGPCQLYRHTARWRPVRRQPRIFREHRLPNVLQCACRRVASACPRPLGSCGFPWGRSRSPDARKRSLVISLFDPPGSPPSEKVVANRDVVSRALSVTEVENDFVEDVYTKISSWYDSVLRADAARGGGSRRSGACRCAPAAASSRSASAPGSTRPSTRGTAS